MKAGSVRSAGCVLCMLAAALRSLAGPLQRADICSDAAWVLHINCDRLRPTVLGQYLLRAIEEPEVQDQFAPFQRIFRFDASKLDAVTSYTASQATEDTILLLYGDFDAAHLVTLAQGAEAYRSIPHNGHRIHSWINRQKSNVNGVGTRTYAAIERQRVLFAQHENRLAEALDVVDGVVPSLASGKVFPQLGAADKAVFIEFASGKVDAAGLIDAILRLAKGIRLEVGEAERQVKATLNLEATDAQVAGQMLLVAQGLVALLKLQKEKPQTAKWAEAISLTRRGRRVLASLAMPAEQAVELLKADAVRKARKHAANQN